MDFDKLLTVAAVADLLAVSPGRVHQLITDNRLTVYRKIGRQKLFRPRDVERVRRELLADSRSNLFADAG